MAQVTVYSTPTCPYCNMTKAFFKEHKVEFTNIDVSNDQKAQEAMIQKTGQLAVPVIFIENEGKEEIIIGFQKNKLAKILGIKV